MWLQAMPIEGKREGRPESWLAFSGSCPLILIINLMAYITTNFTDEYPLEALFEFFFY